MNIRIISNVNFNIYSEFNSKRTLKIISNIAQTALSEFIALFRTIFLFPYAFLNLNSKKVKKSCNNVPVVFVHGYFHNKSGWVPLMNKIKSDKKMKDNPVYALNLSSTLQDIEKSADEVKKFVSKVKKETGCKKAIIVGHSMGGLVASTYTQSCDQVTGVITLSSPLYGTRMSPFSIGTSVKQMAYKSEFTKNLTQSIRSQPKAKYLFIGNYGDMVIVPNKSTVGKGKMNQDEYSVPRTGHLGILYHNDVHKKVMDQIKKLTQEVQSNI